MIEIKTVITFGGWQWLLTGKKHKGNCRGDGNVLCLDLSIAQEYDYVKVHQVVQLRILHLPYVNGIQYKRKYRNNQMVGREKFQKRCAYKKLLEW